MVRDSQQPTRLLVLLGLRIRGVKAAINLEHLHEQPYVRRRETTDRANREPAGGGPELGAPRIAPLGPGAAQVITSGGPSPEAEAMSHVAVRGQSPD